MYKEIIPPEISKILSSEEIIIFKDLQKIIRELNKTTNLTRLIEGNNYWISQVYDSVWPFKENLKHNNLDKKKFVDIGSGCGFPGLAYAITHPNSEVYLIDSSKRKTDALKKIVKNLNFKRNIFIVNDRIENFAHQISFRNNFNIATARAVSNPLTVSEYMLPILRINGIGILYCGNWTSEDKKDLEGTLKILKGQIIERKQIFLPNQKGIRNIILIQPKELCPEIYPRSIGKAKKYPLKG